MIETPTNSIFDVLCLKWPKKDYAHLREYRPFTGYAGEERRIDLWVISRSPSKGMPAHSVEVKVSRADWLREIKYPTKARMAMAISNFMWAVAPPEVVKPEELPYQWGLIEVDVKDESNPWNQFRVVHPADYRDKVRPTWGMIASIIRNIEKTETKLCLKN